MIPGIIAQRGGISGGPPPPPPVLWTPANITTAFWVKANDSATITLVSSAVSQANDKSGNARHVLQGTAGNRPTIGTMNGKSAFLLDGLTDFLQTSGNHAPHSGTWSAFAVAQCDNPQQNLGNAVCTQQVGGNNNAQYLRAHINNAGIDSIAFNTVPTFFLASRSATTSAANVYGATRNTAEIICYANGIAGTPVATTGTAATVSVPICVGANEGGTSNRFGGKIGEIILVAGVVTTDTRQRIEGYLAHEWGTTFLLESDHPYKTNPPYV